MVSAADKLYNVRSILKDCCQLGDTVWERFKGKKDGTLWYYNSLAKAFFGVADSKYESTFRLMLQSSVYLADSNWEILNSYLYSATPWISHYHKTSIPSSLCAKSALCGKKKGVADSESTFRLMLQSSPYLADSNWEILNSYLYSATPVFPSRINAAR
ncbi:MAG: hypothetical protein WBA89_04790 [Microcoleus sp.]